MHTDCSARIPVRLRRATVNYGRLRAAAVRKLSLSEETGAKERDNRESSISAAVHLIEGSNSGSEFERRGGYILEVNCASLSANL